MYFYIALIAMGLALVVCLVIIFRQKRPNQIPESDNPLVTQLYELRRDIQTITTEQRKEVSERLDSMHERLLHNLNTSASTLQKHFTDNSNLVQNVTEKLTKLEATNKQVLGFSEQLQSLEQILRNPKQRGILGEYWLETLLGQVLQPNQYEMQHQLGLDDKTGNQLIPDAVIFVKALKIPIDAKFSLENYSRLVEESDAKRREELERQFKQDVKNRIDETSKYVCPHLGTTDFAFMFIPAEGIYHNLLTTDVGAAKVNARNLIEYAFSKHVMIVSSTPFFAYLQTVLMGLNALKIEDSVKQIQQKAVDYMRHLKAFEDYHMRLGKNLQTTINAYNSSTKELAKMDKDIFKITDGEAGKELELEVIAEIIQAE